VFGGAALLLVAVAVIAAAVPSVSAAMIDPTLTLRSD
jgi:hypothetical protein